MTEDRIFLDFLEKHGLSLDSLSTLQESELRLCFLCLKDDAKAWEDFFRIYKSVIYSTALKLTGEEDEAEELTSELIANIIEKRKIEQFKGLGTLGGWLRSSVVHLYLDHKRVALRKKFISIEAMSELPVNAQNKSDECLKLYSGELLGEFATLVLKMLHKISPRKAAFVNLYYFQGSTLKKIAEVIGVHEATLSRWNRSTMKEVEKKLTKFLKTRLKARKDEITFFIESCLELITELLEKKRFKTNKLYLQELF